MIYIYKYNNINLTAKIYHHNHYHTSCNDMYKPKDNIFGCCNVIDNFNHVYNLSFYKIVCRDKSCSNCPDYNTLLKRYSIYIIYVFLKY